MHTLLFLSTLLLFHNFIVLLFDSHDFLKKANSHSFVWHILPCSLFVTLHVRSVNALWGFCIWFYLWQITEAKLVLGILLNIKSVEISYVYVWGNLYICSPWSFIPVCYSSLCLLALQHNTLFSFLHLW